MIFLLSENLLSFPDPSLAEKDGLLAIGGDLSSERLILGYQNGIFPWYSEAEPISWYSPHERCVIFPEEIIINSSMNKIIDKNVFTITTDTSFEAVIEHCKTIPRKEGHGTWITDEMKAAYMNLHHLGFAHSIEAWKNGELAGGMYGVVVNNIFCGESMFSKMNNASKAVMIWLCQNGGYKFLDCQLPNPHLMRMGARMISQKAFIKMLKSD
ncbi:MAG: leucyl/phenylalanyl-tRNA--protein transferase [Ferruginibacter sp.]